MKRSIIISIAALVFSNILAFGQSTQEIISTSDHKIAKRGEEIDITFTATIGNKAAQGNNTVTMTPVISKDSRVLPLAPIVIESKKGRISNERRSMSSRSSDRIQNINKPIITKNGGIVEYKTTIPYQEWINGATLRLDGLSKGCCKSRVIGSNVLVGGLLLYSLEEPAAQVIKHVEKVNEGPIIKPVETQKTTIERRFNYSFVAPISDYENARKETKSGELFDYNMHLNMGNGIDLIRQNDLDRFIDNNREGSLEIFFRQGKSVIERGFSTNNRSLVELVTAIREIENSGHSKVVRVVIAGFASPEGSYELNNRLAWNRAVAVKDFALNNSHISKNQINIYNGSVDWRGLRKLVEESDMYEKYRILDIIDYTPIWDSYRKVGRLGELMRLNGGDPYRYMFSRFFPQLRNAAYIKVYYDDK